MDRFPIFLRDTGAGNRTLSFAYVDWGAATLHGYFTYLKSYGPLFRSEPSFHFLYLAPGDRFFRAARVKFSRMVLAS